jgi:hypothetical protein
VLRSRSGNAIWRGQDSGVSILAVPKKQWLIPKKIHRKANSRALTGAEITPRQLNPRDREQRLQDRERLVLDLGRTSSDIPLRTPAAIDTVPR